MRPDLTTTACGFVASGAPGGTRALHAEIAGVPKAPMFVFINAVDRD